jgi:hypothetical protein
MVRDWSTSSSYTWTPPQPGTTYRVGIWARDATTTADVSSLNRSMGFTIVGAADAPAPSAPPPPASPVASPLVITDLTSNRVSPQPAGTPVTFTAVASGGRAPYQFKWWVFDGRAWVMVRDWSTSSSYTWTPPQPGTTYRVGIWARDATTTANVSSVNYSVGFTIVGAAAAPAPTASESTQSSSTASGLRITGLTSNLSSPSSMERTVTFTASASGGSGPYQYKWFVFDGTSWTMVRNWSTTATLAWRPTAPGAYRIGIWARDATTAADTSALNFSVPYIVTP